MSLVDEFVVGLVQELREPGLWFVKVERVNVECLEWGERGSRRRDRDKGKRWFGSGLRRKLDVDGGDEKVEKKS